MSTASTIAFTQALDGARILFRQYLSTRAPVEGWVREFSTDSRMVRISKTQKKTDAGHWFRVGELRCEAVLEASRAPALKEPRTAKPGRELPDESGELGLDEEGDES